MGYCSAPSRASPPASIEKINLFMKGQDTDLDQIYEKFGVDYNLLVLLMRREVDKEGKFQIRWGEQMIA